MPESNPATPSSTPATASKPPTSSQLPGARKPSTIMSAGSVMDGIKVKASTGMHVKGDEASAKASREAEKNRSARTRLIVAIVLFLAAGAVAAYTAWPSAGVDDSEPDVRRSWLSTFAPRLQVWDFRAVSVTPHGELGTPGAKFIFSGIVSNQRLLDDLKSKVAASAPPAPVEWKVEVGWVVGDDEKLMPANPR